MTKEEYLLHASSQWESLESLKRHGNFYDYEKDFSKIWLDLGRIVLENHLGDVPADRRKKKSSNPLRGYRT